MYRCLPMIYVAVGIACLLRLGTTGAAIASSGLLFAAAALHDVLALG